jgi:uncharacterized membrane protein YsdA (DUF1294 family)
MTPYLIWLVLISVITFFVYGYDKFQAKSGGWRVPEKVLHGLALAGGFMGGWIGRIVFHHKTRKPVFTLILAISTLLYIGITYFFILG